MLPRLLSMEHTHEVGFSWAAGLFMYQSLDAIDGYARFDHVNTSLPLILLPIASKLDERGWLGLSERCLIMVRALVLLMIHAH